MHYRNITINQRRKLNHMAHKQRQKYMQPFNNYLKMVILGE